MLKCQCNQLSNWLPYFSSLTSFLRRKTNVKDGSWKQNLNPKSEFMNETNSSFNDDCNRMATGFWRPWKVISSWWAKTKRQSFFISVFFSCSISSVLRTFSNEMVVIGFSNSPCISRKTFIHSLTSLDMTTILCASSLSNSDLVSLNFWKFVWGLPFWLSNELIEISSYS